MASSQREVMREIGLLLAKAARSQARTNLLAMAQNSSRASSIRKDLSIQFLGQSEEQVSLAVKTDFYWALYYHDGRGPINFESKPGKFMVFYRDPRQDPRTDGGTSYPKRSTDVRPLRLGKGEFRRLLDSGELIAVKRVGPADPHPFFEVGFRNLSAKISTSLLDAWSQHVLCFLDEEDLLNPDEEIAEFDLGF